MFSKILTRLMRHKLISIIIILVIAAGIYFWASSSGNGDSVRYATSEVQKGTFISSVTGAGQISAAKETDIRTKVSGDVTWVGAKAGQTVRSGQALASIDDTDIRKSIDDAELALEEEQDAYNDTVLESERTLEDAYSDGYNTISTAYFQLADYMDDLAEVAGSSNEDYITAYKVILGSDSSFIKNFERDYDNAKDVFYENYESFQETYDDKSRDTVYRVLGDTIDTAEAVSKAVDSARHMFGAMDIENFKYLIVYSHIVSVNSQIKSDVSSAYSTVNSLQSIKNTIDDTNEDLPKELETAERDLQKKKDELADLEEDLSLYTIYAPYAGIITDVKIESDDYVSSNSVVATIITKQTIAEVSLNEVDIAKVELNQRTNLLFDAVDGLSLTGKVTEIDTLGTTDQGVVTYSVVITLDTTDDRIKPGMTTDATIVVDSKNDVLYVPNSAVKTGETGSYVEVLEAGVPTRKAVETGVSNDEITEIISGLNIGEEVVTGELSDGSQATAQQGNGGLGIPGLSGGTRQNSFRGSEFR